MSAIAELEARLAAANAAAVAAYDGNALIQAANARRDEYEDLLIRLRDDIAEALDNAVDVGCQCGLVKVLRAVLDQAVAPHTV